MKICITPDSVKLFYAYFDNVAEKMNQEAFNKASFSALLKDIYNQALKDFATVEQTEKELKELILQHMTILPKIMEEKLIFSSNTQLKKDFDSFKQQVIEGLKDSKSLVGVIKNLNGIVGNSTTIPTTPLEEENEDDYRFDAISFVFSKTENQDTKVSSTLSFKDNIKDENNTLTVAVTTKVVRNNNKDGLRFKAVLFKDLSNLSTLKTEKSFLPNDLVLVLVDNAGNILKFDQEGSISEEGNVPVYWTNTTGQEFRFKAEALVDVFMDKYRMSRKEAEARVKSLLDDHLKKINNVKENLAQNNEVFLPLNMTESSSGFLEFEFNKKHNLSDITNFDKVKINVRTSGKGRKLFVIPENSTQQISVDGKNLNDVLDEKAIDAAFYMLTNPGLRYKLPNGEISKKPFNATSILNNIFYDITSISVSTKEEKFKSIRKYRVQFGNSEAFTYTIDKEGNLSFEGGKSLSEMKEKFKAHIFKNSNIKIFQTKEALESYGNTIKSKETAEVGDYYFDEQEQMVYRRDNALFRLGIPTGNYSENEKIIKVPVGTEKLETGETVAIFDNYSLREYVGKFGTVRVKLNKDGQLISNYPFISFGEPVIKNNVVDEELEEEDDDTLFQSFVSPRPTVTSEIQEKAIAWFKNHNLSKVISLQMKDEINAKGPNFVAEFFKNAITLYKGSMGTDVFHEAFHAFTQTILSEKERKEIYDTIRNQPGLFKVTVHGKEKEIYFKDASDLEVEEFLAEQFNKYAQNRLGKSKLNVKVKEFFDRLLNMLKAIFGDMRISEARNLNRASKLASKTFEALYSNNIDTSKFVPSSNEALNQSSEIKSDFSMEEVHLVMDSIKSLFNDFVTYGINANSKKMNNLMLALSVVDEELEPAKYESLKQELDTNKELIKDKYTAYGVFAIQSKKALLESACTYVENNLKTQRDKLARILKANPKNKNIEFAYNILVKAVDNLGDVNSVDEVNQEQIGYDTLLGLFLNEYTNYNFNFVESDVKAELEKEKNQDAEDFDSKLLDEDFEKNLEDFVFDRTNNDKSLQELMDHHTKEILSTITKHTKNGKGVAETNLLGFKKHVPLENMIAKVAKILSNTGSRIDMYNKLVEVSHIDNEIKELVLKLGDPSSPNTTLSEQKQWLAFWQALNKADILLRQFVIDKKEVIADGKANVELSVYSGRTVTDTLYIGREWGSNFNELLQLSPFSKEDAEGKRYIDIKAIFDEFKPDVKIHNLKDPSLNLRPFLTSQEYIRDENKRLYNKTASTKYYSEPFEFLAYFGINLVDDPFVRDIINKGSKELGFDPLYIGYIKSSLENRIKQNEGKLYSFNDIFDSFNYKTTLDSGETVIENQPSLYGVRTALQNLHAQYSSDNISFMGTTAYGEKQSEKALNSSLTLEMHALATAKTYDELLLMPGMEKFDINLNPFVAGNMAFVQLFNLNSSNPALKGKRNPKIEFKLENLTGSKIKYSSTVTNNEGVTTVSESDKGIASIDSDENTKFITDFYMTLEGIQEVPRMEAKATSLAFYNTQLVEDQVRGNKTGDAARKLIFEKDEANKIFGKNYRGTFLYDQFKYHLGAELVRIQKLNQLEKDILNSDEEFVFDYEYLERGKNFMQFLNLLSSDTRTKLKNLIAKDSISVFDVDTLISKELQRDIEKDFVEYFKRKSLNIASNFDKIILDKSLLEQYMTLNKDEKVLDEAEAKKLMFQTFTINNFINNMNFVHLFLGDIALYKISSEDFHKRNAGLISSGKISATDQAFFDFVNSNKFNAYGYSSKFYEGTEPRMYNGKINTAVLEESKANSKYIDTFNELIGEDAAKSYLGMDEADGQGWISFDMYRLLNLSYNEWSDRQEALYQKMINGEEISNDDYLTTFPVRKFQYFGSVRAEDKFNQPLDGKGFHKYSLMPLIPGLIAGTKLEKLHEKMMREGVDYAVMKSGSKLSSLSRVKRKLNKDGKYEVVKELDNFYKKDRSLDESTPFVKNIINASHLKNVIYLSEGYKGKVTFASQMRKMVLHGLMENGVPTDFNGTEEEWNALHEDKKKTYNAYVFKQRYFKAIEKLREAFKEELLEDISMTWDASSQSYKGDTKAIVDYIKKELAKNDFLPHEIEGIADSNGRLLEDLSFDLNSQKIESILTALVDKKLRRFKVNGESMVQVSGAMFERYKKPTAKELKELGEQGTNELKFYPITKDKNGKITVAAMEVKISLQGDFKNLIYLKHPDKKPIAVKNENGDINWEASRLRLNEAIKNKDWAKANQKMLQFPGVRIPTQGPNALDVVTVAEFLPEWAGPIVILPSEIVAKTGADYDIDKMFFMLPSIMRHNDTAKRYEYNKLTVPYEELKERNKKLKTRNKEISTEIEAAQEEKKKLFATKNDEIKEQVRTLFEKENKLIGKYKKDIASLENKIKTIAVAPTGKANKKRITEEAEAKIEQLNIDITNIRKERGKKEKELFTNDPSVVAILDKLDKLYAEKNAGSEEISNNILAMKQSSSKGIENEIIDLLIEKILDSGNIVDLITPNGTADALPLSRDVRDKITPKFDKFEKIHDDVTVGKTISPTTVFDYEYNLAKQQENSVGKDALGIAAVVSTFYAIFTTFDSRLNAPTEEALSSFEKALKEGNADEIEKFRSYALKLAHNYSEELVGKHKVKRISLGKRKSANNKVISDTISQLINGFVDVAKDAWVFNIQGNKENTPTLLFMIMSGVPLDDAVALSSNPLVMEYNKIKKEFQGVYSRVSYEQGNPIVEFNPTKVAKAAYGMITQNHPQLFNKPKFKGLAPATIDNKFNTDFSFEKLWNRVGASTITEDDVIYFAHYIQIEEMSNKLTEFQQANKHDTTKVASITDAENNIIKNENFFSKRSIVPESWVKEFEKNPVGVLNNNSLIVDLFKQFFKIKNNPIVNQMAIKFSKEELVKKAVEFADTSRNAFKNDFIWFLYQNAVYNSNSVSVVNEEGQVISFDISSDSNSKYPIDIAEGTEDKLTVSYNPDLIKTELSQTVDPMIRSIYVKDGVMDIKEYVKFRFLFQENVDTYKSYSDKELFDKYYYLVSPKMTRSALVKAITIYQLKPANSLFNTYVGADAIIKRMRIKNPELNNFLFITDLKTDTEFKNYQSNIFLPKNTGKKLMQTYLENLQALRNHELSEVAEFFSGFDHYLVMQVGLNAASKYFMGPLVSKNYVLNTVYDNLDFSLMEQLFDDSYKTFRGKGNKFADVSWQSGVMVESNPIDAGLLDQFYSKIINLVSKNKWRTRGKGVNYITENGLDYGGVKEIVETPLTYNNVSLFNDITQAKNSDFDYIFNASTLFNSDEEVSIDTIDDILKSFAESKVAFPKIKVIAPEYLDQTKIDSLLLEHFGIDNTGNLPVLVGKSKFGRVGTMTVSDSVVKDRFEFVTDEYIASRSTKAIAFKAKQPAKYQSKHHAYIDELKNNVNPKSYTAEDTVWIFGASVTEKAYSNTSLKEYTNSLKQLFDTTYIPEIQKAISAGANTFYIDAVSTGISTYAKDYFRSIGYKMVVEYGPNYEKFYSFNSDLTGKDSMFYDINKPELNLYDSPAGKQISGILTLAKDRFKGLTQEQLFSNGENLIRQTVIDYFADKKADAFAFSKLLLDSQGFALRVGFNPASVYLEKYLMGKFLPNLLNSKIDRTKKEEVFNPEGLKTNSSGFVQGPVMKGFKKIEEIKGAEIYDGQVFDRATADRLFDIMQEEFDKELAKPGQEAGRGWAMKSIYYGPLEYAYGSGQSRRSHPAAPMPQFVEKIVRSIEKRMGVKPGYFDTALINKYGNLSTGLGYHTDLEVNLTGKDGKVNPTVLTLSLGAERKFGFQGQKEYIGNDLIVDAKHGHVLVMGYNSQINYKHGVEKAGEQGVRYSITLRHTPDANKGIIPIKTSSDVKGTVQLELIEDLVLEGKAITTVRNYDKVSGVYKSTKTDNLYNLVNRGKVKLVNDKIVGDNISYSLDEFGKAEGFDNWEGFVKAAKFAGKDLMMGKEVYLYDISYAGKQSQKSTPVFDTLPFKSDTKTMTYAGIGSRETPKEVLDKMTEVAKYLDQQGYTLRSGAAEGADTAFENGATKKEIFKPTDGVGQREIDVAHEIHPNLQGVMDSSRRKAEAQGKNGERSAKFVEALMARNTNQIFGKNLDTPVDFVLAYDKSGWIGEGTRPMKGGTLQAIEMAARKGIPVINMANDNWREQLKDVLSGKTKASTENVNQPVSRQLSLFEEETENMALWNKYANNAKKNGEKTNLTQDQFLSLPLKEQQNLANC